MSEFTIRAPAKASLIIRADGRIEIPEGVTLDEATRDFWRVMEEKGPKQTIDTLRAELAAERERNAPKGTARHIKRGTTYDVLGEAYIQTETPLEDMMKVVVYRCHEDGQLWARRLSEFHDGRFEIARIDAALGGRG